MSAYNAPTETLPRFNSAVFVQNANVSYPVAQGALTIPKNITIVDGSNTIIITPISITINGIVYSLSNIAYLNLSQTFTGVNTFSNTLKANTLQSLLTTDNISLYDTSTAEISIGSGNAGNINIGSTSSAISLKGANTFINGYTLTNTLKSLNSTSSVSLYEVPMVSLSMGNSSSPNTITGYTNTINGNTTFTNTIIGNTITGKAVGDAISLYNTSTGLITLGNSTLGTNTNTIYGITTFNQALNAQTPASLINNTQVPTTAYLTTYYAPLTGTIANATAITLTPNSTDTADYIPFSSTASGSSNLKTSTVLLYNASTGNLSSTIYTTNTLQGQAVSSAISLYTTSTSGGISLGNSSNTNTINGNTTFSNYVFLTAIRAVTPTAGVSLFDTMTSGSISIGGASQTGGINIGTTGSNTVTINGGSFIVSPSMYVNTIIGKAVANNISLYGTTTGTITLGNAGVSANTITGVTNVITGSTSNTINGNTTITNTLLGNTLTGKAVTDAISLYTTSTSGGISLGNSSNTNTINGDTTITNTLLVNTITGKAYTDNILLYSTTTTGTITIGSTTSTLYVNPETVFYGTLYFNSGNISIGYDAVTNNLFNNITTGNTTILPAVTSGTLTIGNTAQTGSVTIYGAKTIGSNSLFTNTTTGNTSILTGLTSGTLTIGNTAQTGGVTIYGANTTGANNLFTNATTSAINIGTGLTTGSLSIGTTAGTNTINGNTTITNTLLGNTITGKAVTDAISLYTTSTSGGISLGNSSNTNTINGNTTITNTLYGNTLQGTTVSSSINLYTLTTGTITIGNTSGTNTINGVTTLNNYITTSIFNPIVSTNSLLNMILSNKTGSISGQNNTGLGVGSLSALTTGRDNTAIGTNALITITDQNYSTAVGSGALGQVTTTGIDGGYNTAVGSNAGNSLKYGKYNCFFGQLAGTNMSVYQADYNTFLGAATSFIVPNTGFSNSTAIGYGAIITASNQIMLGRVSETVIAPNNITITNTLNGNTLAGKTTTDAISLYTTSTSGGIILGNSSNTNTINGNTTITNTLLGNTITGKAVTDNISLFTTTTTGTMNFVSGLTTGICYIGNSVSTTGQMIIYGAVSGTSTLFSNVVAGAISIGNSALTGVMTIYGSISNTNNLFTNVTTGAINIGTSCSGIVTIGKTVQSPNPNSTVNIVATDLPIYGNLQLRGKYGQSIYNLNQSQYYTTSSTLSSPLYQYNIACFSSNGTLTIPDAADAYIGVALYFKNACNPSTVTMTIKTVSSNNFFGLTAGSIPTTLTGQQIMVVCITYAFGSPVSTAPVWVQMI